MADNPHERTVSDRDDALEPEQSPPAATANGASTAGLPHAGESAPLLGATEIRRLAAELDIRPTKKLGQNFVIDGNTIRKIIGAANIDPAETVLEVGPGLGSLTLGILDAAAHVIAVEIDERLARRLPQTIAELRPERASDLTVITKDALKIGADELVVPLRSVEPSEPDEPDEPSIQDGQESQSDRGATTRPVPPPTALVANLPYNVAVPVVLHLLATVPTLTHGLVMVQDEVADRMVATPGSKIYGIPSVKLAWYAQSHKAGTIGTNVFWPAPNISSGLVAFQRRKPPRTGAPRTEVFALIDAAFAQRRKTLRAALAQWAGSGADAENILRQANIDPSARGETLDVTAFANIAGVNHANA